MAMTEQYGYGVLPYGVYGYGGFWEAYAEQPFAATDEPMIAYRNRLGMAGSSYQITIGAESAALPLTNAWNDDLLVGASVTTSNSIMQMVWNAPFNHLAQVGYGVEPYGAGGYGGADIRTPIALNCLVFGATRHEAAGLRSVPTRYRVFAESGYGLGGYGLGGYGGSVLDRTESPAANASLMRQFDDVNAVRVTLTIWGLPTTAKIPGLYLGRAVRMPYLEHGFDPYNEVSYGSSFVSESGREYPQLRYRKMELSPKWSFIDTSQFADIADLRENAFEIGAPVWFNWAPNSHASETYLMRQSDKVTPFPYVNARYRSLSLKLVEAL